MHDITVVDGLPLPRELVALIEAGVWPRATEDFNEINAAYIRQHAQPLVTKERMQRFAPEERQIYLASPPFHTLQTCVEWENSAPDKHGHFWQKFGALDEIDPRLTVDIADFEIGSDSCVALDYQHDRTNPSVIRLKWSQVRELQTDGTFRARSETH